MKKVRISETFFGSALIKFLGDSTYERDAHFAHDCDISASMLSRLISGKDDKEPSNDFVWRMSYVLAMRKRSDPVARFEEHKYFLYELHKHLIFDLLATGGHITKKEINDRRQWTRIKNDSKERIALGVGDATDRNNVDPRNENEMDDHSQLKYDFLDYEHFATKHRPVAKP